VDIGFGTALLIAGALLAVAAGLSGVMRGTVLSISVLSVSAGIIFALTDVISVDANSETTIILVELALIVTLFSDGLFVERELLRHHWGPAARALVVAMPLTLVSLALFAKLLFTELTWAEAFLLGAVLSPTDPVVTSVVVTSRRVPARIRHTLNLESGLNDGLALPLVLFFLVLATPGGDAGREGLELLGEAAFGAVLGLAIGYFGGRVLPHLPGGGITRRYEGIYALGLGLFAFGVADVTFGNGLIAAFVGGIALGAAEHDIPEDFVDFSENVSSILQVLTFFVFGALIVATGYDGSIPALAAFVAFALLVARPGAVLLSFVRSEIPPALKAFIAWFGPKGVASMLFALFVLKSDADNASLIFDIAAFAVLSSILAHGLTDTVGASWVGRRVEEQAPPGHLGEAGID
jgi:NhaP-type Na+/H+ or K+/H+ antiporter